MGCQGGKEEKVDEGDKLERAATPTMGDSPEKSKKKERVPFFFFQDLDFIYFQTC